MQKPFRERIDLQRNVLEIELLTKDQNQLVPGRVKLISTLTTPGIAVCVM